MCKLLPDQVIDIPDLSEVTGMKLCIVLKVFLFITATQPD